jgi:YhcH/YjgK/YiaL family protein
MRVSVPNYWASLSRWPKILLSPRRNKSASDSEAMIFGNVKAPESSFAWLPKPFRTAIEHLRQTDFNTLPAGNYDLQGRDICVQVIDMTTKPFAETRPEVHRQYVDVQFLVRGREKIGVAYDTGDNRVAENLLAERDLLFYSGVDKAKESMLTMTPGSFAVFLPSDVHRPGCAFDQPEAIRKVVVKIRVSLLAEPNGK